MTERKKRGPTPKNTPWSVKGVSPETREAVKKAARRSGQTIGEWMDENLRIAATDGLKGNLPAQRMEDQLEAISTKLDRLNQPFWKRIFGRGQSR